MTIKFLRNTHDADGTYKAACTDDPKSAWHTATFSGHMGSSSEPMTFSELVEQHRKYDKDWSDDPFGYTIPEMLIGLAQLVEAGLYKVVEEE